MIVGFVFFSPFPFLSVWGLAKDADYSALDYTGS